MDDQSLQRFLDKLRLSDLPNLWKPRADRFFRVEALPYLGTGKLDLRGIYERAERKDKQEPGAGKVSVCPAGIAALFIKSNKAPRQVEE